MQMHFIYLVMFEFFLYDVSFQHVDMFNVLVVSFTFFFFFTFYQKDEYVYYSENKLALSLR